MAEFSEAYREVFNESLRATAGMLACKERSDHEGARVLASGVLELGIERGFEPCQCWSIMFSAALHWFMQVTTVLSREQGRSFDEITQEMTMLAAIWESSAA